MAFVPVDMSGGSTTEDGAGLPAAGGDGAPLYSQDGEWKNDTSGDLKFNSSEAASESSANTFDGTAFEAWNLERTFGVQFTKDYLRLINDVDDILVELTPEGSIFISQLNTDYLQCVSIGGTGFEIWEEGEGVPDANPTRFGRDTLQVSVDGSPLTISWGDILQSSYLGGTPITDFTPVNFTPAT